MSRLGRTKTMILRALRTNCMAAAASAPRRFASNMAASRMKTWFPTTAYPLVISAPMDFVTNAKLATEVTKAGGLGFLQGGRNFAAGHPALESLDRELARAREALNLGSAGADSAQTTASTLPIGVGFVTYPASVAEFAATTAPILARHRPAAVWLFAPSPAAPTTLADVAAALQPLRAAWGLRVVVQVGTVAAARQAVRDAAADVIVAQGVDAGGHQWAATAGIVSLVPEIADMLRDEFPGRDVAVWAAGGMADGRGVAASVALGAEGAVLGTRFMVATESSAQDFKRQAILSTSDGATNTAKSQLHDHIQGNKEWPDMYDGRAIVHPSYTDSRKGVPFEENLARFKAAKEAGDLSRMVTWSGTGVGLIKEALPAGEILRLVREDAIKVIRNMKSKL